MEKFGIVSNRTIPAVVGLKLDDFKKDEDDGDRLFHEVIGTRCGLCQQGNRSKVIIWWSSDVWRRSGKLVL